MKTNVLWAAVLLVVSGPAVVAQTPAPPPPVTAIATAPVATADPSVSLQPTRWVYTPRLPAPQELADVAAARGMTIDRIEQSASQVSVAYLLPDGRSSVVGYVLLPSTAAVPSSVVVTTPAPTVVYQTAPRVVYYDPYFYDPWYAYPRVSVGFGLAFGPYYNGHYGHFHGGHRGRR